MNVWLWIISNFKPLTLSAPISALSCKGLGDPTGSMQGGEWKGGTGSADLRDFNAKSANPDVFKVKSESAKVSAENEQKTAFQ